MQLEANDPKKHPLIMEPPDLAPCLILTMSEMFPCSNPVTPHMRDEAKRLETFDQRWPNRIAATPAQIAKAGFFFLGERDRVKCWYCNGSLQNWDDDDEPWSEHAKWFPECAFILQRKGPNFVHQISCRSFDFEPPVLKRVCSPSPSNEFQPRFSASTPVPVQLLDPASSVNLQVTKEKKHKNLVEEMLSSPEGPIFLLIFLHSFIRKAMEALVDDRNFRPKSVVVELHPGRTVGRMEGDKERQTLALHGKTRDSSVEKEYSSGPQDCSLLNNCRCRDPKDAPFPDIEHQKNVVESDGSVVDGARDPPCQSSIYIIPGNTMEESYRLNTFSKFPPDVPVIPRDFATAGFYYTGYKDRVKCFSCGLSVENWVVGDDVKQARWHKTTCDFANGRECGNIPIANGGLYTRQHNVRTAQNVGLDPSNSRESSSSPPMKRMRQSSAGPVERGNVGGNNTLQVSSNSGGFLGNDFRYGDMASEAHESYVKSLDLTHEKYRRFTFNGWSGGTTSSDELAKCGFFYLGNLGNHDRVQCFSCGAVQSNRSAEDLAASDNRGHFPNCRMAQRTESRNVLLTGIEFLYPCDCPQSPHMREERKRLETFDQRWPNRITATPAQMANAGFFFLGEAEKVKCWYCNVVIENWNNDADPWLEHARSFPGCQFTIRTKGSGFVENTVSNFFNISPSSVVGNSLTNPNERVHRSSNGAAPAHPSPQTEERTLDQRVEDGMCSQVVGNVLEMGFPVNLVRQLLKRKIMDTDTGFQSESEFLDAHEVRPQWEPSRNITNMNVSQHQS